MIVFESASYMLQNKGKLRTLREELFVTRGILQLRYLFEKLIELEGFKRFKQFSNEINKKLIIAVLDQTVLRHHSLFVNEVYMELFSY